MTDLSEIICRLRNLWTRNRKASWTIVFSVIVLVTYIASPYYVMFIVGTSMEPEIEHHDILLASEAREPDVGDSIDVQIEDDGLPYDIVHEVIRVNSTHVQTKGINRSHSDNPAEKGNVEGEIIHVFNPPGYLKSVYKPFIPDTYEELEEQYS